MLALQCGSMAVQEAGWHKHHSPALLGTRTSLCCAGCLPCSPCFFGLLLFSKGTKNKVPQQSGLTLCCEFSHSHRGTEKSLAQTQQVPLDCIGSLPTWTMQVKADLSALLPRKHIPFSQKGGCEVEISRVHVACQCAPKPGIWLRTLGVGGSVPLQSSPRPVGRVQRERRQSSPSTSAAAMPLHLSRMDWESSSAHSHPCQRHGAALISPQGSSAREVLAKILRIYICFQQQKSTLMFWKDKTCL